jgi:hypothetical protein
MKRAEKILFLITLSLILTTLIYTNNHEATKTGTIKSIKYANNRVTIYLDNNQIENIAFTKNIINLKENDKIKIIGKESVYKNKKQIIINKIYLIN